MFFYLLLPQAVGPSF